MIEKTKFPNKIRDAKSRSKDSNSKDYLPTMAKIVYLFLVKEKFRDKKRTPSYSYIANRYGISKGSYGRALKDLEKFGAITIEYKAYKNTGVLDISLVKEYLLSGSFELVPSVILDTDVYTNDHKLFLAMLWKMFYKQAKKNKDSSVYVYLSDLAIAKEMKEIGFSRPFVSKMLSELSNADKGWFPCLIKIKKGYELDTFAMSALSDREIHRWEQAKSNFRRTGNSYPVYQKPEPFDFSYIETEEGSYVAEHRVERTPAIIKKLSKGGDTYEEAKERFDNANFEEYEG